MARERRGFIVVQVWADITYTDRAGQQKKLTKQASAPASGKTKHKLTDAEKQKHKIEQAKRIIRETIIELKREGATDCKGIVSTRIIARVGHTDEKGKRRDVIRVAESRTDARDKIKQILHDLDQERGVETLNAARSTFADLVTYYRTVLKDKGDLVFQDPPTHMFEVGKFNNDTMSFPPGVTIKDFTSGGSQGYANPKPGAQPARFASVIMIVPVPPGTPR